MKLAYEVGVSVPEPISQNRHVIAMGMIEGAQLSKYKDVGDPKKVLKEILLNLRKAYTKAHIIHADISEYNIIVRPDMHILIIDWPQSVLRSHPNAEELLERDVKNVVGFFSRKFRAKVTVEKACSYVLGTVEKLGV